MGRYPELAEEVGQLILIVLEALGMAAAIYFIACFMLWMVGE